MMPSSPRTCPQRRRHTNRFPMGERPQRHGALGKVLLVPLGILAAAAVLVMAWQGRVYLQGEEKTALITETVKRGALQISITERGRLESGNNKRLVCEVEGEVGTGIMTSGDETPRVKEGSELVMPHASKLRNDGTA